MCHIDIETQHFAYICQNTTNCSFYFKWYHKICTGDKCNVTEHAKIFIRKQKKIVKQDGCMKFYDAARPLYLVINASRISLGARLLQIRVGMNCRHDVISVWPRFIHSYWLCHNNHVENRPEDCRNEGKNVAVSILVNKPVGTSIQDTQAATHEDVHL